MLDKFLNRLRWHRLPGLSTVDRSRIGVIRHRVATRLDGRRRATVATAAALAAFGLGAVTVNATEPAGPDVPQAQAAQAAQVALERSAAAERADRGARADVALADPLGRAAAVLVSPTPTQTQEAVAEETTNEPARAEPAAASPAPDWVHPMPEGYVTSCMGWRWGAMHAGVDLAAPHGTPIRAVGAGTVTHAGWVFGGYGISVVIDHGDGHHTHYAHAAETKVSPGDRVEPGDIIALEGSTGDSTGPHLHFEVHKGGLWNQVEPTTWMANRGVTISGC